MKNWKEINWDECDNCGESPVEVFTDCNESESVFDGDEARCPDCNQSGYVSGDEGIALIHWND